MRRSLVLGLVALAAGAALVWGGIRFERSRADAAHTRDTLQLRQALDSVAIASQVRANRAIVAIAALRDTAARARAAGAARRGASADVATRSLGTRVIADRLRAGLAEGYSDALLAVDAAARLREGLTPGNAATRYPAIVAQQDTAIHGLTIAFAERTEESQTLRYALRQADTARALLLEAAREDSVALAAQAGALAQQDSLRAADAATAAAREAHLRGLNAGLHRELDQLRRGGWNLGLFRVPKGVVEVVKLGGAVYAGCRGAGGCRFP